MTEEDYNWPDEQTNTIKQITVSNNIPHIYIAIKLSKNSQETSTTSTAPTTTSRSKTFKELSNEIPTRKKRSTGPSARFDNNRPVPTDFMAEKQRQVAPIDEHVLQGLMSPTADQVVMGERGEHENILGKLKFLFL